MQANKSGSFHMRMDPELKRSVSAMLYDSGLTLSVLVNMMCTQIKNYGEFEFHLPPRAYTPNRETIEAIAEGEQMLKDIAAGKDVPSCTSAEELFKELRK